MLEAVYETVKAGEHGVLMIDAPTGCGKTSCISAALAAAPGKVVVALRTVSQIDIYLDWIARIWANTGHHPEVSYMVGKQKVCPLAQEFKGESVYSGCSRLRNWTKDYMVNKLKKSRESIYDPSRDQIPDESPGYRTFCPHYLHSREAFELNGKVYYRRSGQALDVVERLRKKVTPTEDLVESCARVCPYEVMSLYAKSSDIVIMNYSHLFSPDFQDVIFQWLELDPQALTLIVDEAHNLGDAVRAMNTRVLTPRMIDLAEKEVDKFEDALGQSRLEEAGGSSWRREGIRTIKLLLPRLRKFIASRDKRLQEGEHLLDGDFFREFLYNGFSDVDEALTYFSDVAVAVSEMKLAEGDHENVQGDIQPSLALVLMFLRDLEESERDMSYQSRIVTTMSGDRRWTRLEVVQIDPAPVIRQVVDNISSTIMLSGTFSPLDAYELYCLGEENRARKLSLPNPFPAENRLLLVSAAATTQLEAREDMDNRQEIADHIGTIIDSVPGNVAVFFTSYSMMNSYREICKKTARLAGKKLYTEPRSSDEVSAVLAEFFRQGLKGGAVLLGVCGGKLAEGIDYKGETLNGVAVVGLPLGAYDEIQREINDYYARKYGKEKGILIAYTLPAINRGLQAAGRVIRAEDERGVILFCDRRFNTAGMGGVKGYLPEWVRGELSAADASQCRKIIRDKQIDWSKDSPPTCHRRDKSAPEKPGARNKTKDLRSLVEDLGLGKVR